MSQAAFTINGTPSVDGNGDRIYIAANGETLTCTLELNPSQALSVLYEVYDPADGASPLASKDAPLLTWNENSLPAYRPSDVNGDATVDMPPVPASPATGVVSYIIRCTVATAGDGSPLSQQQVFERLVVVQTTSWLIPLRKTVPGETTQGRARAWSDALNDMVDALELAGQGGDRNVIGSKVADILDTEMVVGGLDFTPVGASATLRALGTLATTSDGLAYLRLYDLGAPGSPISPVLRSTLTFANATNGVFTAVTGTLTPVASPAAPDNDEIYNVRRLYEVRLILNPGGTGAAGDTFVLNRASVEG